MILQFHFNTISIMVNPSRDFCTISKEGFIIWSGKSKQLIAILESI